MKASALTDRFGRHHTYLRISVTDRCNLRCTYCMPEHVSWTPQTQLLSVDEIVRLGRLFVAMGISKIRLTGGEPLTRPSIGDIAAKLRQIPKLETLAMTTNGIFLEKWAPLLRDAGLDSLTVSLDSLRASRYAKITRRDRLHEVMKGIDAALETGFSAVKINIVVIRGVNDDELLDFVAWGHDRPLHLRFIEYMPFPDNHWSREGVMSYAEMYDTIASRYTLQPLRTDLGSVGKDFALLGSPVTLGFVTSMTESFCGTCTRLRLTADGHIKSCLFGTDERMLRDLMRQGCEDNALRDIIQGAVLAKPAAHAPIEQLSTHNTRNMIAIGG